MKLKYYFVYIIFLWGFGMWFLIVMTPAWWKGQQRLCSFFTIDIAFTETFKEAITLKKSSNWIDDFQSVTDDISVYSAFDEGKDKVRVIGVTNDIHADLHCILWYNGTSITTKLTRAYITNINENHRKRFVKNIIVPYVENVRDELDLPLKQRALCIFDIYKAHQGDELRTLLQKHNIQIVYIPASCTDRLQPLDLSVNSVFKQYMEACFGDWYSDEVASQLLGCEAPDVNVDMRLSTVKPIHAKITAAYFLCYLCDLDVPDAVSIVQTSSLHFPNNILPVHAKHEQGNNISFTMCLSPLHASFSDAFRLLEWIEFHKLLGVEKFQIYVQSITCEVEKLLKFYQEHTDMVKVLPWSLADLLCDNIQIHYCGQLAALNDCLYRNKGHSHYTALTDVDELIVPQHKDDITWHDMLVRIPHKSVYTFRNTFVKSNHKYTKTYKVTGETLMAGNLMRDDYIYGPIVKPKMIVRTDDVVTLGIHHIWALRKGNEYPVDPSVGLLHHYRKESVKYPKEVTVTRIKNNVTLKYLKKLKARIAFTRKQMK